MSSCISFHISNSSAALYSRVSRGSGWFSGTQGGWVWGACHCWPAPTHWHNSGFLVRKPTFQSVQGKMVKLMQNLLEKNLTPELHAFSQARSLPKWWHMKALLFCCLTWKLYQNEKQSKILKVFFKTSKATKLNC